ncbi:MAG: hypothetical protein K7J46_21735 [Bryobacter sp.]|nr:hypothetical protein [Bryobacter sp. CoA8 C33]
MLRAAESMREAGMRLPGNWVRTLRPPASWVEAGSKMGLELAEKSPLRWATVGTVRVRTTPSLRREPS